LAGLANPPMQTAVDTLSRILQEKGHLFDTGTNLSDDELKRLTGLIDRWRGR